MTALSIINMRQSPLHPDNIRDFGAPKNECAEIVTAIRPFFTREKWVEWCDAGPENNAEFLNYARAEWQVIHDEFHMDEPPAPLAEQVADEITGTNEKWLDVENQPHVSEVCEHTKGRSAEGEMLRCAECNALYEPRDHSENSQVAMYGNGQSLKGYTKTETYERELGVYHDGETRT